MAVSYTHLDVYKRQVLRDAEKTSFKHSGVGPSRIGPRALTRFLRQQALITNVGACTPLQNLGETKLSA